MKVNVRLFYLREHNITVDDVKSEEEGISKARAIAAVREHYEMAPAQTYLYEIHVKNITDIKAPVV